MVSQLSQFDGQEREDAFPFATENPSGVPGITEIEGRVIAAIAGHVAEGIEGVVNIGRGGLVRTVTSILASEASDKASGIEVEAGKREAILDIDLTVMYGHSIPGIVKEVRETVAKEIFDHVGLVAKEINVVVTSIEFPDRSARARLN
jgi:uncharacterized alkaline shock family protein YloU